MGRRTHYKGPTGGTGGFGRSHSTKPRAPITLEERVNALSNAEAARRIGELEGQHVLGGIQKVISGKPKLELKDLTSQQLEFVLLVARRNNNRRPEEMLKELKRRVLLQGKSWKTFATLPGNLALGKTFIQTALIKYAEDISYRRPKLPELLDRFVSQNPDENITALTQAVHMDPNHAWNLFREMFETAFGQRYPGHLVPDDFYGSPGTDARDRQSRTDRGQSGYF